MSKKNAFKQTATNELLDYSHQDVTTNKPERNYVNEFKKQGKTAAEDTFCRIISNLIESEKLGVKFKRNQIIEISKASLEHVLKPLTKISEDAKQSILNEYKRIDNIKRKPDFIFHDHKLVIEIDGKIHDNYDAKIKKDIHRDYIYKAAGYDVLVIQNRQLYNPVSKARLCKDLKVFLKRPRLTCSIALPDSVPGHSTINQKKKAS